MKSSMNRFTMTSAIGLLAAFLFAACTPDQKIEPQEERNVPPGVVVSYIPRATEKYIGSPSLCVLPNGDYLAAHDFFGPQGGSAKSGTTQVFRSKDKGVTWKQVATVKDAFWSNLFVHDGDVYLLGTQSGHGNIAIHKSVDDGNTWSDAVVLFKGHYHTAPTNVVSHKGRLWRAFENADAKLNTNSPDRYGILMISCNENVDLMNPDNWSQTNCLVGNPEWMDGQFKGWMEGNALVTREGNLVDVARVHIYRNVKERIAIADVDPESNTMSFKPVSGFSFFPGGTKKFTILYDPKTDYYLSLVNDIKPGLENEIQVYVRNSLSLACSKDLKNWKLVKRVLDHPDVKNHAFQYVDWLFEGNDIIFLSRTAYDDALGGADSGHNANYLTFHRLKNYAQYIK